MNNLVADGLAKQDVQTVLAYRQFLLFRCKIYSSTAELEGDAGNELSFDLLS